MSRPNEALPLRSMPPQQLAPNRPNLAQIPRKPLPSSSTHSSQTPPPTVQKPHEPRHGRPLKRYWLRALLTVFVPPVVTIYYFCIWVFYLRSSPSNSAFFLGPRGALWVFYSWFIVAVVGLNLSAYGLRGIEASMMMDATWAVRNAALVMMHGEHSWSGPGGWLKTVRNLFNIRSNKAASIWPSKLWWVLASQSFIVFLALPISGLVMNLGSGFVLSTGHPSTTGFTYDNFNMRYSNEAYAGAGVNWRYAIESRVPGMGVIYTPPGLDRSNSDREYLEHFPNYLPSDVGVDDIFLIPQAETPVHGDSWGLAVKYNCSVVTDTNDFSILNNRNASKTPSSGGSFTYTTATNDSIVIYNQTDSSTLFYSPWADNLQAVMEIGFSQWPKWPWEYNYTNPYQTGCYNEPHPELTGNYPGLDDESVFEVILWQSLVDQGMRYSPSPSYDMTLDSNITNLYGAYKSGYNLSMSAIGVRCSSSSAVGHANIDPTHLTFSDFHATDTPIFNQTQRCAERLGPMALWHIFDRIFTNMERVPVLWLNTLFSSVSAPPPLYAQFSDVEFIPSDTATGGLTQLSMFQATDLRNSLLNAYGAYAVQLAYNGGQGYSDHDGTHSAMFTHPNLTAYEPSSVLQPGVVPPLVPAILLLLWTFCSVMLGCWYGFRKRWAETLDAYSLFVFGIDLADKVQNRNGLSATVRFEESEALSQLPGLIGDMKLGTTRGRIGLVERTSIASTTKLYT